MSTGRRASTAHEIRAPEDIGDDEIAMVAENVKEKRYDTEFVSVLLIFLNLNTCP